MATGSTPSVATLPHSHVSIQLVAGDLKAVMSSIHSVCNFEVAYRNARSLESEDVSSPAYLWLGDLGLVTSLLWASLSSSET